MQTQNNQAAASRFYSFLNSLCFLIALLLTFISVQHAAYATHPAYAAPMLTGIEISPSSPSLDLDQTLQLTTLGNFDDGSQQLLQPKIISAGGYKTCVIVTDGTVQCMSPTPTTVNGLSNVTAMSNGMSDTCVVSNGTPSCAPSITNAKAVSTGATFGCALLTDGAIKCWTFLSGTPVTLNGINNATTLSVGYAYACAVLATGEVQCWHETFNPITISGLSNAIDISVNHDDQHCTVIADGTVKCNGFFEGVEHTTPTTLSGVTNAIAVSSGREVRCALIADGTVKCWGHNLWGGAGDGTSGSVNQPSWGNWNSNYQNATQAPVTALGINNAVAISAGDRHVCALLADGAMKCWGENITGAAGTGRKTYVTVPTPVTGLTNAANISAYDGTACATLTDGTVSCWGSVDWGQSRHEAVGLPFPATPALTPVPITGVTGAFKTSVGMSHACAAITNGSVQCWGLNDHGQLGNGTGIASTAPVTVTNLNNVVDLSSGGSETNDYLPDFRSSTCAVQADGQVKCWGYMAYLGTNYTTPVTVSGINNAVAVSGGYEHYCAILSSGEVMCWGTNAYGQLGNGTRIGSSTAVLVQGITNAVAIEARKNHSCAKLGSGAIQCWGNFGRSGSIPSTVSEVSNATAFSFLDNHNCAVLTTGTVQCWGTYNSEGELGNGTTTASTTPVTAIGINNAVAIIAMATSGTYGGVYTCALLADGKVSCWGSGMYGQLGNGYSHYHTTPTLVYGFGPTAWSSNDPNVATVTSVGLLTAVNPGTALITVNKNEFTTSTFVTAKSSTDLSLTIAATPTSVEQGQAITYTLVITNYGPSLATGVTATGSLPTCSVGNLAPAATASCTSTVTATTAGTVTQTMTASGSESDPVVDNNTKSINTVVNANTDLSLSLSASPTSVLQGQVITYTLSITNNGPSSATGVNATGTLSPCTIGNLAPAATASCTATVTPTTAGTLTQTMTVSGNETDPVSNNNSHSVSTIVTAGADVAVSITDAPDPVRKGANLTYTITVTNNGPSSASNVTLTDILPANTVLVRKTTTRGSCSGSTTISCNLGNMLNGSIATVKLIVKTKAVATISNTATVTATEDYSTGNNSVSVSTVVKR